MVLKSTDKFCFGEVLRSGAGPHYFLSKQVMIMLAVIFGDLLDAYPTLFVTMIEWKCVTRPDQQT